MKSVMPKYKAYYFYLQLGSRWIDQFFIVFGELIAGFCNKVTCTGHYSREGSKHAERGS
jgi:hypothetical protein